MCHLGWISGMTRFLEPYYESSLRNTWAFWLPSLSNFRKSRNRRDSVLNSSSKYFSTLENTDDRINLRLAFAVKLMFLRGDADCSLVDTFFDIWYQIVMIQLWMCWHLKTNCLRRGPDHIMLLITMLSGKFSKDKYFLSFCFNFHIMFKQSFSTSILYHVKYIRKNFLDILIWLYT